jgi:hypothetical protein
MHRFRRIEVGTGHVVLRDYAVEKAQLVREKIAELHYGLGVIRP